MHASYFQGYILGLTVAYAVGTMAIMVQHTIRNDPEQVGWYGARWTDGCAADFGCGTNHDKMMYIWFTGR